MLAPVAALVAALPLLASTAHALAPITAKGSKLFNADGSQFYLKGVAYQLTNDDPLVNTAQCKLDAALMKELGANAIRVYHVDASADHDGCMAAFDDAGIYTLIDLDTFTTYIIPPGTPTPEWTATQYTAFQKVMDTFQRYDNVLAFFVGNEMIVDGPTSMAAPFIKAAARDMKIYRDERGYRQIPVGYSAADIASLRPNLQNYLVCGGNTTEAIDFYSLNTYEWCGDATFDTSGYVGLQQNATGYPVPIFFSEDGCNMPSPRTFADQASVLGPDMDGTWSGAIIYEWIQINNDFGLIQYGAELSPTATGTDIFDGFYVAGTPTPIAPDFANLKAQWATLNPTGVSMAAYNPSEKTPACPSYTAGAWQVSGNVPLPTLGESFAQASRVATTTLPSVSGPASSAASSGASASASASGSASTKKNSGVKGVAVTGGIGGLVSWTVGVMVILGLAVGL